MKTKTKKAIALALCAVMLIAGTALTTVAYLTDQTGSVVNTFTIGNIEITLDEALVNEYGEPIDNDTDKTVVDLEDAPRVYGNDYKLIPGVPYVKDPTVKVAKNSEDCYVRMIVTVRNLAEVKAAFGVAEGEYFLPQYYVQGWNPEVWRTTNVVNEENNTATYEFRYYKVVNTVGETEDLKLEALFDTFTVPGTVTELDLAEINEKGFSIDVVAHAIQAKGFTAANGKKAEELAWEAFDEQN